MDGYAGDRSCAARLMVKKEEEEDYTFDEPCLKKQKTGGACQGRPTALQSPEAQALKNELNMNWDLIEVLWDLCFFFEN